MASAALRSGEVSIAWTCFKQAHKHQLDQLGNENHFNYKFEDWGFREEVMRRRCVGWLIQKMVVGYMMGMFKEVKEDGIVVIIAKDEGDWVHGLVWFLAAGLKGGLKGGRDRGLVMKEVEGCKREWVRVLCEGFLKGDVGEVEDWWWRVFKEGGEGCVECEVVFVAFYLGLFWDAVGEKGKSEEWFERCVELKGDDEREISDCDDEYDVRRFLVRIADLKIIGKEYAVEEPERILSGAE